MDKLPTLSGNAGKIVAVNASSSALESVSTLAGMTLTNPVLTLPKINDTSLNHEYVFAVSELTADRTVTLPLLASNDTFVFAAHAQTLTNKAFNGTLGATTAASVAATTGTFSGTLGVTGTSTLAAVNATNGTFSGTLGVTGAATFGSTVKLPNAVNLLARNAGDDGDVVIVQVNSSDVIVFDSGGVGVTFGSTVSGAFNGTLGATTRASILATTGNFNSTLGVTGAATFASTVAGAFNGTLGATTRASILATTGNFNSTLGVTGAATFSSTVAGAFNGTLGATTRASVLATTGNFNSTLGVTGSVSFGGALGVTGSATLGSSLGVTGAATFGGAIGVTGSAAFGGNVAVGPTLETWHSSYDVIQFGQQGALYAFASSGTALLSSNVYFDASNVRRRLGSGFATELVMGGGGFRWDTSVTSGFADSAITDMTAKMQLSAGGGLSLGGSTPYSNIPLRVTSAYGLHTIMVESTSSISAGGIRVDYTNYAPNGTVNEFFRGEDSVAIRVALRSNGGIANYQANDVNLSDEREKNQFGLIDCKSDCVRKWEIVKYLYKDEDQTHAHKYGVIAQQILPHCPEVISEWVKVSGSDAILWTEEDDLPRGALVGDVREEAIEEIKRIGVLEQQMFWMVVKSHQEALDNIDDLTLRIKKLETV